MIIFSVQKNLREISKNSAAKIFFFENFIFQNAIKWSNLNLKLVRISLECPRKSEQNDKIHF